VIPSHFRQLCYIKKENIISAGRVINMDKLVNKDFYNIIKNRIFVKPIVINFWTTYLEIQDFQNKTDLYGLLLKFKNNLGENILCRKFCTQILNVEV
jgi:hypothetical protein